MITEIRQNNPLPRKFHYSSKTLCMVFARSRANNGFMANSRIPMALAFFEDIFSLNWGTTYKWKNEEFKEMNFIAFVTSKKIILNEKSSKYKWLHIDKFIKEIRWGDNTALLKNVLEKGIKKELYFDNKERGQ